MFDSRLARNASYLMQRQFMAPDTRKFIASAVSRLRPRRSGNSGSPLVDDGYLNIGKVLSPEQIQEITDFLGSGPIFDPYKRGVSDFTSDNVPTSVHLGQYHRSKTIRAPHLLELANRPDVLQHAEAVIGCKPSLTDMLVWWSFPGPETPVDSQLWHRDRADWRMAKFFVYLVDVSETTGPHVYARKSVNSSHLTDLRRYKDEEVRKFFSDIVTVTGEAGSGIMTNPMGLHRASLPTAKPRLIFEATYSLMGLPPANYDPYGVEKVSRRGRDLDPWINRYFVND